MEMGERLRKVSHVLAFTAATVLVLTAGFFLTRPFFPNVSNDLMPFRTDTITAKFMTPYWSDKRFNKADPAKDKIMLSVGDAKIIDDIKIVYRGSPNRSQFQVAVFVMDFDREMPFVHTLDVAQAKKGFRMAGKDFQLISARKHRIHLWYHKKGRF